MTDMSARQKAFFGTVVEVVVEVLICVALLKCVQRRLQNVQDEKKVRSNAYALRQELKRYVRSTDRFPESLTAMVAEGALDESFLSAPPGCTINYRQPSPMAAGTAAVYVVTSSRLQGIVGKDFRIAFKLPPQPRPP